MTAQAFAARTARKRKAPWLAHGAFFCARSYTILQRTLLALFCTLLLALPAAADCVFGDADELVTLARVLDGDTLELRDGRRVRLIGVNTPELAHNNRPAQPLAEEARQFTERFLAGGNLELVYDRDRRDRYGRWLAHVYNQRGDNLEAALLSAGLAFHVAVYPNVALAECLSERERSARAAEKGLWAPGVWPAKRAADVHPGDGGFVLLRGQVRKVARSRRFLWLDLDGPVALRLRLGGDSGQLGRRDWQGAQIEVKGWLVDRGAKYVSRHLHRKRFFIAVDSEFTVDISKK